jgi:hypothetical protein
VARQYPHKRISASAGALLWQLRPRAARGTSGRSCPRELQEDLLPADEKAEGFDVAEFARRVA